MADKTSKAMMAGMMGLVGMLALVAVVDAMTPSLDYCCPICGVCFATYDELYAHFTSEHPTEDIEIIWE